MRKLTNIMVTGGAGFIGSNFIRYLFGQKGFTGTVVNVDKLTYAGNPENLTDIDGAHGGKRYFFEKADVCDFDAIKALFEKHAIDTVIHFAAESHVDRSIFGPKEFIQTNIMGTFNLLEVARECWTGRDDVLFHHISTDEVYGSLGDSGYFFETTPYDPRSPYSASKASSDHLVMAYSHTYDMPVTLSNCSNNYGPYQFPEKLIPLMIQNIKDEKPLPVYGDGRNVRDWLYVDDHNSAVWLIVNKGKAGETYNIGGENEWENLKLVHVLCEKMGAAMGKDKEYYKKLITFVKDRPGHDRRYAINCDKIKKELGWRQSYDFDGGLDKTIRWYLDNEQWTARVRSGEYRNWIEKNYDKR
ncbi:MAG TPA: dTDP-glucose 4,6-dehydratase [Spirochaetota bacterium]|nr:dTDP-glucose 4,6-dehydratase [Spirochaetota bacterium]HPC41959.1 dTDP-glucose 4,6-dehydratase [Spirochaetota bacterium]HQF06995.1 dTDP-glucose 4,6-dehydratase [Spirochaetota bacterium]HQH95732.1 dTDP-glucose 4,6-dehydratase [Spirochaetota bacterium]HQJ71198.1 dTDP-glucose 4,6-dehydratase [Spirochaetota bacterium]